LQNINWLKKYQFSFGRKDKSVIKEMERRGHGKSFVKNQYKNDKHKCKMMSVIINFFSSLNINIK
jgi:hypothetical protein